MDKRSLAWGAGLMATGVALGAFGAHGLKAFLGPEALGQWNTGVLYHFLHALGLLALGLLNERLPQRKVVAVRALFLLGILCFSGSLYILSIREIVGLHSIGRIVGPITPLGGLFLMAAWVLLLITTLRNKDQDQAPFELKA